MSWGFEFKNNDDVVILDSEYARLSILSKGRFVPTQESGLGSATNFERVITTQEPPLVFVKPDNVGIVAGLCRVLILGSPGNWTGFYVRAYDVRTAQPRGSYFAAAYVASPTALWGGRLYDQNESLIFDTGTPSAVFSRSLPSWNYVTSGRDSQGLTIVYFSVPFVFSSDEYMLINNFGMDVAGSSRRAASIYCWWDFTGNRLWALTAGATPQNTFYIPAVFAKMQA
ncbi:hypothetical protein [Pseudomonas fluorescens]|uniref:Prophage PssSM-03 n=1 Tax=Pseudomonas fluorescens TaxID=294 RepID=A0A2N1E334_PSEFL|nr:hypothetical protein [Pseudomonas fluorescens]PKH18869.1 hypothetical protein CIB54_17440 [Pseudomonas fluorescens]